MNDESEQLRKMILGVRSAYQRGENAMEFARATFGQAANSPIITLLAYDLQAGNYIKGARADPAYRDAWCGQLANLIAPHLEHTDTLMEVGCGEATTLAGVINFLPQKPRHVLGFDISWSRCAHGMRWLAEKSTTAQLFVGDLFNIPMADASVDVIYTSHSLEPNGGREKEAISELLRVARKKVILIEPSYELSNSDAQARMRLHGYVRNLRQVAEGVGAQILDHHLLPVYGNPLNPSGILILEKNVLESHKGDRGDIAWQCPISATHLTVHSDGYYAPLAGLLYPVLRDIPLLRGEHAIVASAFTEVQETLGKKGGV